MQKEPQRRLTPQEKDDLAREYKIGKYREWVFDAKRIQEIAENYEYGYQRGLIKAGVNYIRKNYPEYDSLSDQEIIDEKIYKLLWRDIGLRKIEKNKRDRETREIQDKEFKEFK